MTHITALGDGAINGSTFGITETMVIAHVIY
jgi:hypothetical protein